MPYFWDTADTIPDGLGFSHFDGVHLSVLAVCVLVTVICCLCCRKMDEKGRSVFRKTIAVLLIADELFKLIPMWIFGTFRVKYLPFQPCSVNIFLIAWHAWKPNRLLGNFLYAICIPGAAVALLFPTWTELPLQNYMFLHSTSVHILLILYPVVLTVVGEIRPSIKELPKSLMLLLILAAFACVLNILWGTNFMFLMKAGKGNPLYWFGKNWGDHRLGFPVLISAVILVMYGPLELYRKWKK